MTRPQRDAVLIVSIVCLAVLEVTALLTGRNGVFFSGIVAAIAAIAGVRFGGAR